jgi:hypothetical protein
MSDRKTYAMAVKFEASAPAGWRQRLAGIEGVSVTNASDKRAQFTATPHAANAVKSEFSDAFHIEEIVGRKP